MPTSHIRDLSLRQLSADFNHLLDEIDRKDSALKKACGAHIPIIAMSARALPGDADRYLASGMDGYVSKPVHIETLRAEIDRWAKDRPEEVMLDMTAEVRHSSISAVNFAELLARVEHDRELLRDLVTIFKVEFPKQLQALRQAVERRDTNQVAAIAHILKGMLSSLAAHQAAESSSRLEQLGRNGDVAAIQNALSSLEREAAKVVRELDTCMAEVTG